MTLPVRHFYHAYADGAWGQPAAEHAAALRESGFAGEITVGLVGSEPRRAAAREWFTAELAVTDFTEADTGWEQVTLTALAAWARQQDGDAAVLYAHTKGAMNSGGHSVTWRRSMTRHLVGSWRHCVSLLGECDAVGCHWLTPQEYPETVTVPFFGGNFWWARAGYLAALPEPGMASRYDAEGWVGLGQPRVHDLLPGWPNPELLLFGAPA